MRPSMHDLAALSYIEVCVSKGKKQEVGMAKEFEQI